MASSVEIALFVHRSNIAKYGRMLTTYLTELERRFIERRLAEEQAALQHLVLDDQVASVTRAPPVPEASLVEP